MLNKDYELSHSMDLVARIDHSLLHNVESCNNSKPSKTEKEGLAMADKYPKYVTQTAMKGLIQKIDLPAPDEFSQDWEYEVSDAARVSEFLYAYENVELTTDEKFALMIIIISSFDDAILEGSAENNWSNLIRHHLLQDHRIHKHTILYWAMLDEEDMSNVYAVTPFMREIAHLFN